ncbi:MAG: hypothetical protein ABW007_24725 [Chitinophagaceae bacterium]
MIFYKNDLNFLHYRWVPEVDEEGTIYSGGPTRRTFDPFNGNQVLFLINCYGYESGNLTLKQVHEIENKIAYNLPTGLKSERSVFNWIVEQVLDKADRATS